MRTLILIPALLFMGRLLTAQEAQPVRVSTTDFKRIEIVRLKSGTDMLEGLNHAVQEGKIRNGVILAAIGSVTDYHFHVVGDKNLPPAEIFIQGSTPMDLVSAQGYIFEGRVHAHISLSDSKSVIGGHLEPGTKTLTFIIITIGVLSDDSDISRFDDYTY